MRILHVVSLVDDQMGSGGPLTVALNQCAELRRRGHDARLVAAWRGSGEPPQTLDGVPAHLFRVGGRPGSSLGARISPRMTGWLRRTLPLVDLVHVHGGREALPLLAAAQIDRAGVPYVIQTHGRLLPAEGGWQRLADQALIVPVLRSAAHRLAIDPGERTVISRLVGHDEGLEVIGDGVWLGAPQAGTQAGTRADPEPPAVPERPLDVVTVARLHPSKQVLAFAEAAVAALELGLDATFSVIGPDDGDLAALHRLIATHDHLDGRLRYEGALGHPELLERLARADLFVLPAMDGCRSMVLLEALAAGLACICTDDTRHALTLRAHQAALVTRSSGSAIAQAVVRLADDPALRARFARQARQTAAELFDVGAVVDQLLTIYRHVLEQVLHGEDDGPRLGELGPDRLGAQDSPENHPADPRAGQRPVSRVIDLAAPRRPLDAQLDDDRPLPHPPAEEHLAEGRPAAGRVTGPEVDQTSSGSPEEPELLAERLLWVATTATAHRMALWREVAGRTDLTVAVLAGSHTTWRLVLNSEDEPFHVVRLRARSTITPHGVRIYEPTRALRDLIRTRPDAVVLDGWESPAFHAAARWARREEIPVIAAYQVPGTAGGPVDLSAETLQRTLLRQADAVLAAGTASLEAAVRLGVPRDRVALATDPSRTARAARSASSSEVVDVRDGHRFAFVGPLVTPTNPAGVIRAFHLGRGLGDVLTIAGDGPLLEDLVRLSAELGIGDSVIFLPGEQELRSQVLEEAHTVVVPSTDEVWAPIVHEALDRGRHVVVSTACAVAGSLGSRPTVFVCEPEPTALARAMMSSRQHWGLVAAATPTAPPRSVTLPAAPLLVRAGERAREQRG